MLPRQFYIACEVKGQTAKVSIRAWFADQSEVVPACEECILLPVKPGCYRKWTRWDLELLRYISIEYIEGPDVPQSQLGKIVDALNGNA